MWLSAVSFRNRMVVRLRRLRDPKYLIGFIAALVYFWFMFLRRIAASHGFAALQNQQFSLIRAELGAIVVLVIMLLAWLLPTGSGGLEFSPAEIQFLFPAPLARWQMLLYNKLLRTQPQIIGTCLVGTIAGFGGRMFIGLWLSYTALNVYFTFVAFARVRLQQLHVNFFVRLIVVGGAFAALVSYLLRHLSLQQLRDAGETFTRSGKMISIGGVFDSTLMKTLLFLPRQYVQTAAPSSLASFALASTVVAAMGVLFFFLAVRLDVAFEEASVIYSAKRAERAERRNERNLGTVVSVRRMPPLFTMRETGIPEVAIVWKNLIAATRTSVVWTLIVLAVFVSAIAGALRMHDPAGYTTIGAMMLCFALFFPIMGTGLITADFRTDLARLDILKSFPISGERLLVAELAAPLVIISIVETILVMMGAVLVHLGAGRAGGVLQTVATPEMVVIWLLAIIPICATQLLIRNGAAVLFPAWALRSKYEPRGFAVTGQRIILLLGILFINALALLPPLVVLAGMFLIGSKLMGLQGPMFLAVIALPPIATLLGELWIVARMIGARYDSLDISNDIDAITA